MRLYEFQAKELFAQNEIPIPRGYVSYSPEEAREAVENLGVPVAVKAQVLIGGRGLAGGIRFADNPDETQKITVEMLGGSLKKVDINCVLVEEKIPIETEYYISITIDYQSKCPNVTASSEGGVKIERIATEHPDKIVKEKIDSLFGLTDFQARRIAKKVGLRGRNILSFGAIVKSLYKILYEYDANLVEINPLAFTPDNRFIAVDGKIILDDSAIFRHHKLFSELQAMKKITIEGTKLRKALAEKAGIPTYVELGGNMGIIADGAGTGMLTLDLTKDYGGEIESYCELGGRANPKLIEEAMNIILTNENVRVLLINLFGGLNRMDEMAKGITAYLKKKKSSRDVEVPDIVIRMSGTLEEEGRKILSDMGLASYDNIYEAIERAVKLARRS